MFATPERNARPSLTLKRRLAASPARVYAAWTEPSQIVGWFGPTGAKVLFAETDVRVDGCLLTLIHEMLADEAARDGHVTGWNGALDKLENFLA
jgi:uncharacterized protein YndB with AHSA1/START domain